MTAFNFIVSAIVTGPSWGIDSLPICLKGSGEAGRGNSVIAVAVPNFGDLSWGIDRLRICLEASGEAGRGNSVIAVAVPNF